MAAPFLNLHRADDFVRRHRQLFKPFAGRIENRIFDGRDCRCNGRFTDDFAAIHTVWIIVFDKDDLDLRRF